MADQANNNLPSGGTINLPDGAKIDFGYHTSGQGTRGQHWTVTDASGQQVEQARDSGIDPATGYGHRVDQLLHKGNKDRVKDYPKKPEKSN